MKNFKKFLSLLLCFLFVILNLCSCKKDEKLETTINNDTLQMQYYQSAKEMFDNGKTESALAVVNEAIEKYGVNALLSSLKVDIENNLNTINVTNETAVSTTLSTTMLKTETIVNEETTTKKVETEIEKHTSKVEKTTKEEKITEDEKTNSSNSETVDMSKRIVSTPNLMFGQCYAKNSADGVKLLWNAKNISGKTINYYTVRLYFYNAVGDPAHDKISGESYKDIRYVGPVNPNDNLIVYSIVGYFASCRKIVIGDVTLEYDDGTIEKGWWGEEITRNNSNIL